MHASIARNYQMDKYEAYEKYQQFDETEYDRGTSRYAKMKPRKKPNPTTVRAQLSDFDDSVSAWR